MSVQRFMNRRHTFEADISALDGILKFVDEAMADLKVKRKIALNTRLLVEEMMVELLAHTAGRTGRVRVRVKRLFGDAEITISAPGESFDPTELDSDVEELPDADAEAAERAIRAILFRSKGENLKLRNKYGRNHVRICLGLVEQSMLAKTLLALALGLLCGILLEVAAPSAVTESLCTVLFEPARNIFMNALKIVIAPVVFFSIVSCIGQFRNLSELGRIGVKVMGMYILTTAIAVILAQGMNYLLHPGSLGFAKKLAVETEAVTVDTSMDTSLLNTIVNIVPDNFVRPFLEADTLQLIFLAVIVGIAVTMIGEYAGVLQEFFAACNSLFLTMTTMIARFIPVAVFCSALLLVVDVGGASILPVLSFVSVQLLAVLGMLCVYGLLILVLARLNPLIFYKKNRAGMLTAFSLASSSAAMPTNLNTCTKKLGISPKVCNFSIPLGATVNMDGTCVLLTVGGLFLARAYGVVPTPSEMISLGIMIILLSLGAPGVPGSGLVCMGVVLQQLNVPVEVMGLIIGIYPILDMVDTMNNCTGDVATALIVAKSEGLLDEDIYYSK